MDLGYEQRNKYAEKEMFRKLNSKQEKEDLPERKRMVSIKELIGNELFLNITILDLRFMNLNTLPDTLGNLPISKLDLSNNNFSEIPKCFYTGLKTIKDLNLCNNKLVSFIVYPECIHNLEILNLSWNNFKNIPFWITTNKCVSLRDFDYSGNEITNYTSLERLRNAKLKRLCLRNNDLLDKDFVLLKKLKLTHLDISNNNSNNINHLIDLKLLLSDASWINLKVLVLSNLSISVLPDSIFQLQNLKELNVSKNAISWIADHIKNLKNLEILDISSNELVSVSNQISNLKNLSILELSSNNLDKIDESILNTKSLKVLDLFDNYFTELCDTKIPYIDFEYNLFCTKKKNFKNYNSKLEEYRKKYSFENRAHGLKIDNRVHDDDDDGSSKQYFDDDIYSNEEEHCSNCDTESNHDWDEDFDSYPEDENWDDPNCSVHSIKEKNELVSPSDDEWEGWEKKQKKTESEIHAAKIKFYRDISVKEINNELWQFIDAD